MKKLHIIVSLFLVTLNTAWSQIPTDLTNTVRVVYRDGDMEPDYGVEYHYYKTNSQYIFLDYEERSLRDYTWSSDTGRLTKTFSGKYNDYTYLTASEGTCVFSEGSTGTFAIYDASWDLDHNGTPDGEQIDAGILPNYLHKQLGLAASGSSSFWLSNEGVSASDLSLAFSEQQIDVIASGNDSWGIVNATYVSESGQIDTLSWDEDWMVDVVILNSVPVTDGGIKDSGSAINQAVMWLGLRTTATTYNTDGLLEIVISNLNGKKRIGANSDDLGDFNASLLDPPVGEVHIRLSYNYRDAKLTSAYSYDGNQYVVLSTSSVAALQSYINRDSIAVELGAESDYVQIEAGENTFKEFVVVSAGIVTSAAAQLTVVIPPGITAQPAAATANQGASASFSVTATGTNLSYQWKRNGADLAGETGATLSLNNLQGTQAGSYTVVVSNSAGSVTSNAAVLTVLGITSDLERLTLKVGTSMSYRVTANPVPTTYVAKSLPAGLKINAKTGVIFGKPTKAGEYTVTLQALRKGAATLSAVKTFRVLQAPTFKLPAKVNVTRNKAFRSAPKVSAYPSASFSVVSGTLPEGITLNPSTGQISGITGTVKGNYAVTIRGSNEAGKTDVKTVLVVK